MKLNELADNKGARKAATRIGRGIGSGKGKTGGRGMKGQKSRSGVAIKGFEGGQMPIFRRLPKRGFVSMNRKDIDVINVGDLQKLVDAKSLDAKSLDAKKAITPEILREKGYASKNSDGVKLLAKGELKTALTIQVNAASKAAIALVEKAGGKVELVPANDTKSAPKKAEAKPAKKEAKPEASAEKKAPAKKAPAKAKKEADKDADKK